MIPDPQGAKVMIRHGPFAYGETACVQEGGPWRDVTFLEELIYFLIVLTTFPAGSSVQGQKGHQRVGEVPMVRATGPESQA